VDDLNHLDSRKHLFDPTFVIIFFGFLVISAYLCLYYWFLFAFPVVFFFLIIGILVLSVLRSAKLHSDINGVVARYQPQLANFYCIQNSFSNHHTNRMRHPVINLIPTHERPVVVAVVASGNTQTSFIPIFNYENSPRVPPRAGQPLPQQYQQLPQGIPLSHPHDIPLSPSYDIPLAPTPVIIGQEMAKAQPKLDDKMGVGLRRADEFLVSTEQSILPQNNQFAGVEGPSVGYYKLPEGLSQIGTIESNRRGSVPQDQSNVYQLNFQSSSLKGAAIHLESEPGNAGYDNKFDGP
jgi:hypothetical protein